MSDNNKYKIRYALKSKNETKSQVLFRANSRYIKGGRFQIATGEIAWYLTTDPSRAPIQNQLSFW